jgi:predicted amidophosphoribosyltransferase
MSQNKKINKVLEFWKEIKYLSYSSAVWGYKYNKFHEIAEKFGIWVKCCYDKYYDITEMKFCPHCGKKLVPKKVDKDGQ